MENRKIIRYNIDLLNQIVEKDSIILLEDYTKINRETKIRFLCFCGEEGSKTFRMIHDVSGFYCKKCTVKNTKEKQEKVMVEKYGVKNAFQNKEIKEKIKETNLKKYGTVRALDNPDIKKKVIETNLRKYGTEYSFQSEEVKQKIKSTNIKRYGVKIALQNPDIMKKKENTNIKRYGFRNGVQNEEVKRKIRRTNLGKYRSEYGFGNEEVKRKIKETFIEKYGTDWISKSEVIKKKIKETNIKKYGVKNPLQNPDIKQKQENTNIKKYGVAHPLQNKEIQIKTQINSKKYKEYIMPSGKIKKVQGYEPFALDELIKIYEEDDITTERKNIPRFKYIVNEKNRYYFPDIFIKSINKIIEVKSAWTYKAKTDNIKLKAECVRKDGYEYEIWIFNAKGDKEIKYE